MPRATGSVTLTPAKHGWNTSAPGAGVAAASHTDDAAQQWIEELSRLSRMIPVRR